MAKYPIVSDNLDIQLHYEHCRRQGTSHTLAEMFAHQTPPQSDTDREFMIGTENGRQFDGKEKIGEAYKTVAERQGVSVKGKKYISQLAEFPGDPRAWVDGKGDIKRLAEERGYNVSGRVNVKAMRDVPPPEPIAVAEDIVQDEMRKEIAKVGDARELNLPDLREKIIQKRRSPYKKKA